jgi:hypothetical protein
MTALAPSIRLPRSNSLLRPRLVSAEVLKLRKRRGLVATVAGLTIGAIVVAVTILVSLHAANPAHHGPAGGVENLGHEIWLLGVLGSVAGILVGATAGAGDLGSGIFRELVVTGRSRAALYAARIPSGLAVLFAFVATAYALASIASVVFAGWRAAPSTSLLVKGGLWLLLATGFWFAVGLGLSSLIGSRTTPIAVLLPFHLALSPLLVGLSFLGAGRDALPLAGLDRLLPREVVEYAGDGSRNGPAMSYVAALVALAVWVAVSLALGAWRTKTRDA